MFLEYFHIFNWLCYHLPGYRCPLGRRGLSSYLVAPITSRRVSGASPPITSLLRSQRYNDLMPHKEMTSPAATHPCGDADKASSTDVHTMGSVGAGAACGGAQVASSIPQRARTCASLCRSGTLCSMMTDKDSDMPAMPLATDVRYVLDEHGFPVVMINKLSVAGSNIVSSPCTTALHCHDVVTGHFDSSEAVGRVTFIGEAIFMTADEAVTWRGQMVKRFPKLSYNAPLQSCVVFKLRPDRLYFAEESGAEHWVNVTEYQHAVADVLGSDLPKLVNRYVIENQMELKQLAKHRAGWIVDDVDIRSIDRFGITLRARASSSNSGNSNSNNQSGGGCMAQSDAISTSAETVLSVRIPFGTVASSKEDVKSEIAKLFQEAWEKEHSQ